MRRKQRQRRNPARKKNVTQNHSLQLSATTQIPIGSLCRHGLICGTSGSGKTTTAVSIAAKAANANDIKRVVIFDVKGDVPKKLDDVKATYSKVRLMDIPMSLKSMGPELLADVMGLTKVQRSILDVCFRVGRFEASFKSISDVIAICHAMVADMDAYTSAYGHLSRASIGVVIRELLSLKDATQGKLFKDGSLDDLFKKHKLIVIDASQAEDVYGTKVYRAVVAWVLRELYTNLPEVKARDVEYAIFIDEAHILFKDSPREITSLLARIMRLIRSKGVGVWWISQYPTDVPDDILGMVGNKIVHMMIASSPSTLRAVKSATECLPAEKNIPYRKLMKLRAGEAYASLIQEDGRLSDVELVKINVK